MGDHSKPKFQPDELAPGEPAAGGVAGYRRAIETLGRSALVPSYADAMRQVRTFEEGERSARADLAAAIKARGEAVARLSRAEGAKIAALGCSDEMLLTLHRICEVETQSAAHEAARAEAAERRARAVIKKQMKSRASWADWAAKAWRALEEDIEARRRAGEIECFGFPSHDLAATRRVRVPFLDSLVFSYAEARGAAGRLYESVCFYPKSEAIPEAASIEPVAPAPAANVRPVDNKPVIERRQDATAREPVPGRPLAGPRWRLPPEVKEPRLRGDKKKVWEALKRLGGPPDRSARGALTQREGEIAIATGVDPKTVHSYLSKKSVLGGYMGLLIVEPDVSEGKTGSSPNRTKF